MSNKNIKDYLISIWKHRTTGEFLIAMQVAVMQKLLDNKYVDKNGDEWKLFNPLETTCQLGRLELKSAYSNEFKKDMESLNISTGVVLEFRKAFIDDSKNVDEYGHKMWLDNIFTMLYKFGSTNGDNNSINNSVNKNFNFSYVGINDDDVYGTNANDFWRQYFAKICASDNSKYMLFYKHMNLPFRWDGDVSLSLNTSLSKGHIYSLRKQIADKGHFLGCDGYIYDFNEIYPKEKVELYKKYIDFILNGKLPDKSNNKKQDYASEIIKHLINLDQKSKDFIYTNKVEYNIKKNRFEMNIGKNRYDATAWVYSRFFTNLKPGCKKYWLAVDKNHTVNMDKNIHNLYDYNGLIGVEGCETIVRKIIKDVENAPESFYFIKNAAEYLEKSLANIDFIDEKAASELKKIINSEKNSGINKFFSKPEEIKAIMLEEQEHLIHCYFGKHDLFQSCFDCINKKTELESVLSQDGNKLLKLIQKGLGSRKYVCKKDEFEKFLLVAVARALFETFQFGGDYNYFVDHLRIYVSPIFKEDAYELLKKSGLFDDLLVLFDPVKLSKPFHTFETQIKKIRCRINSLSYECQLKHSEIKKISLDSDKTTDKILKEELEGKIIKLREENANTWNQVKELQKKLAEEQNEMDSMFLTGKDFDFLQEPENPIISQDDFGQTANDKLLDALKKKIDQTKIKNFVKSKFGLLDNDDRLQQSEQELKADLCKFIAKEIKDYGQVTDYNDLSFFIETYIRERFDDELNKAIFNMVSNFKEAYKYNGNKLVSNYQKNMSVMRIYHFIQHVFNAVGHLAFEKCDIEDMQMIIFNKEEIISSLRKNLDEMFLIAGKNAFDSLLINLIKGTSLAKNRLAENIVWLRNMILGLDEKTVNVKEISQFSLAAFNDKNRKIKNGFFSNSRKGNIIQNFFIPIQTLEEQIEDDRQKIWTKIIKPKIGSKIKLADLNTKCDLILDSNWKRVTVQEMLEYSKNAKCEELNKINFIESEDEKDSENQNDIINECCFIHDNNRKLEMEVKSNLNKNKTNISCESKIRNSVEQNQDNKQNLDNRIANNDHSEEPKVKLIKKKKKNTFKKITAIMHQEIYQSDQNKNDNPLKIIFQKKNKKLSF